VLSVVGRLLTLPTNIILVWKSSYYDADSITTVESVTKQGPGI